MNPNKTDEPLKTYVLDVLARLATAVRFVFVVKDYDVSWRVAPHAFGSVASAIRPDMISVEKLSKSPVAREAGAAYDHYNDIMYVDEASPATTGDAAIVAESRVAHETIHTFFDVFACRRLTRGTSEAAAYIVQAAFLESRGKGPPISVDTYAVVLREAFAMLGHSRKGETLTQVELAPLRAAIVVDYKRRLSKTYTGKEILKLGMGV